MEVRVGLIHVLKTKRLILQKAVKTDASFFYELLNSPNWIEFIGDRGIKTTEDALSYIDNSLINSYEINGYGLYKMSLIKDKTPIGICGFVKRDYLEHPDIGFAILPQYEGNGFVSEAATATLSYGLSKLRFKQIFGITTESNVKSQHLLLKIGLKKHGFFTNENKEKDLLLFSINH